MPSVAESLNASSPLAASLRAGLDNISSYQTITFRQYVRVVLPLDGYVFWVRADLDASAMALAAEKLKNPATSVLPSSLTVSGSLHYSTNQQQNEDETIGINNVIFTSKTEIQEFNQINSSSIFIGEFDGIRFAFTERRSYYKQADLHHYVGDAIYPVMESQIIDDPSCLDIGNVIVSNSLPVWLGLNKFMPIYPSFAVPDNIHPPYAVAHIAPESTTAIQSAPSIGPTSTHDQLVKEMVKITIYGLRNFNALDFQDYVLQYSLDYDVIGIMNMPVIRDDKRTQSELNILAQKKSIEFEVSYYQSRVRDVARQLILTAIPTFVVAP